MFGSGLLTSGLGPLRLSKRRRLEAPPPDIYLVSENPCTISIYGSCFNQPIMDRMEPEHRLPLPDGIAGIDQEVIETCSETVTVMVGPAIAGALWESCRWGPENERGLDEEGYPLIHHVLFTPSRDSDLGECSTECRATLRVMPMDNHTHFVIQTDD